MPVLLTLHPPGAALDAILLPRLVQALRAGDSAWYLIPDARTRTARVRAVSRQVSVLNPPVGTLSDFAARLLHAAGEPVPPRPDPALAWLLMRRAMRNAFSGDGIAQLANAAMREMEDEGWTDERLAAESAAEPASAPARLAVAWRTLREQCPERDADSVLRRAIALVDAGAPRLLLIEAPTVAGEREAAFLAELVRATMARGGEVVAACSDLPPGQGRHARGLDLLRRWLDTDGIPSRDASDDPAPGIARLGERLFRVPVRAAGTTCSVDSSDSMDSVDRVDADCVNALTTVDEVQSTDAMISADPVDSAHAIKSVKLDPDSTYLTFSQSVNDVGVDLDHRPGSVDSGSSDQPPFASTHQTSSTSTSHESTSHESASPNPVFPASTSRSSAPSESASPDFRSTSGHDATTSDRHPPAHATPDDVVRLHAPDDEGVADLVAREIRQALADADDPARLLDGRIAVVCADAGDRARMLRALDRLGIPAACEARMPFSATAGGRWLLALLDLLRDGGATPASTAAALLASDAWGYPPRARDAIARRIVVYGAATAGDVPGCLPDDRNRARLERVLAASVELRACTTAAECAALFRTVLPPPEILGPDNATRPVRAAWRRHGEAHGAQYAAPLKRADALVEVLSEAARRTCREPSAAEWLADLGALAAREEVRIAPAPARGVRLERPGRIGPADVVFVLGLVEGRFPAVPRRQPFLPGARSDAEAGARAATRADEQRASFLLACTAARRRLYLCHPRADADGREVLPSFWIDDVADALGHALPVTARRSAEVVPPLARAWGSAELRTAMASALADPSVDEDARVDIRRSHDHLLREGITIPITPLPDWTVGILGDEERGWMAERSDRVSASQLDTFGHCAFRHFVRSRLEPSAVDLPVLDAGRRGSRVHAWLFAVGTQSAWGDPDRVLDAELARGDPPETEPSILADTAGQAALEQWRRRVRDWARAEAARIHGGVFRPVHHELAFGRTHDAPCDPASRTDPIDLRVAGTVLRVAGAIDRVDAWTDAEGVRWGVAIDYKTSRVTGTDRNRTRAMLDGQDLQLPLYLHVLEAFGFRPAGALYLSVRDGGIAGVVRKDFAEHIGPLPRTVAQVTAEEWDVLRQRADGEAARLHATMRAGELQVAPREWDCGYCEHRGICRIDLRRAREAANV